MANPTDDKHLQATRFSQSLEDLWDKGFELGRSIALLRWVGYGLLLLSLLNAVALMLPLRLMNPEWEFNTFGALVEQSALSLVALGLVFLGGRDDRHKREWFVLKSLSWLALLLGSVFFLLIPLAMGNTARLDKQANQQLAAQSEPKFALIQQIKQAIDGAKDAADLEALVSQFNSRVELPKVKSSKELQDLKQKLGDEVARNETKLKSQLSATRSEQRLTLLKASVKTNLGALIVGTLFILIWRLNRWAR